MISQESLEQLGRQYQTGVFPNIIREYFQHLFLESLYKLPGSERLLFKGGTALRILYGSPRFSEDLDFSISETPPHEIHSFAEHFFIQILSDIERSGVRVELGSKSGKTSGGYFGIAAFQLFDFPRVRVEINISDRLKAPGKGEVDVVAGDFIPAYTICHLPQAELVEEKIFGALRERKKPRDFYDLYFIMRRGMLSSDQKKRLALIKDEIITAAQSINFRGELGAFLPADQQTVIRDFSQMLEGEMRRQTA